MTLRDALESAGFVISARPFRFISERPIHHMRRGGESRETRHEAEHYSVDLMHRQYNRWGVDGDGVWHPVQTLLQVNSISDTCAPSAGTFVAEVLASGFELAEQPKEPVDFGNRFVTRAGVLYLACKWSRVLVDRQFARHTLDDLLSGDPADNRRSFVHAPKPFVSMRDEPLTFSGRKHQPTLF